MSDGTLFVLILVLWLCRPKRAPRAPRPDFTITSMSSEEFVEMCLDMMPRRRETIDDPR